MYVPPYVQPPAPTYAQAIQPIRSAIHGTSPLQDLVGHNRIQPGHSHTPQERQIPTPHESFHHDQGPTSASPTAHMPQLIPYAELNQSLQNSMQQLMRRCVSSTPRASPSAGAPHRSLAPTSAMEGYLSFDAEFDGPTPLKNSMRSLGIALFIPGQTACADTFSVNLLPQESAVEDLACHQNFWCKHPHAWRALLLHAVTPTVGMRQLAGWLRKWSHLKLKWVAAPASNDWLWLHHYWYRYGPTQTFSLGFFCHDLSSLMRAVLLHHNIRDADTFKRILGESTQITHIALQDAIHQGTVYMNLRQIIDTHKRHTHSFLVQQGSQKVMVSLNVVPMPSDVPAVDPETVIRQALPGWETPFPGTM